MRAIVLTKYGGPEVMQLQEVPDPDVGPDDIRVNVAYTALNRADLLQRMGRYAPPGVAPEYEIPGLEYAGTVESVGSRVTRWRPGDRVFGLLSGGGYAEKIVTHESMALPVPERLSLSEAAGVAEVFLTAYDAIVHRGRLKMGERILVHAGGSGVGTAAIQIARAMGTTVWATVGSPEKAEGVRELGAHAIEYKNEHFASVIQDATHGQGVDVVLDFVGSPYLADNMQAAAVLGRIVIIGLLGGAKAEINLETLMRKRLTLVGTVLRSRSFAEKVDLTREFAEHVLPLLQDGRVRPIIDREFALEDAAAAHEYMAANRNLGKVLLRVSE